MMNTSSVDLTIAFDDPDLDEYEKDEEAQRLVLQMSHMDEVETVSRVRDHTPPTHSMGAGFLLGILTAEVNRENAEKVLGFLVNRLSGKAIELEVEANGRKLKVKASNQTELKAAIEQAQKFINS